MLTLVGAVRVGLVAVVSTVVVPITRPVFRDTSAAVALELGTGAGVTAASLVAVVPTVIVWREGRGGESRMGSVEQPFCDPSLAPLAPSFPPAAHPTPTEKNNKQKRHRNCIDCSMHHGPRGGGGSRWALGGPPWVSESRGWGHPLQQDMGTGLLTVGG